MKRALQAILIAGQDMAESVILGDKKITIREGTRDYSNGPVMIGCHELNWAVLADIHRVSYGTLQDIPIEDIHDDGFDSHDEALAALQAYYPDLELDSPMTVVRWDNVRGVLVGE